MFFHFDLCNLSGLQDTLLKSSLPGTGHPDHSAFLCWVKSPGRGQADDFIVGLCYRNLISVLAFCNQLLTPAHKLPDLQSCPSSPGCAVPFLAEERPPMPEVLTDWMTRLSRPLFGEMFSFAVANIPTPEEALARWRENLTS